jgi:glutamyl-Q tRNA(Asp) synthetase
MALDSARPMPALHAALDFLGQRPPADLVRGTVAELWAWAGTNWRLERVPRGPALAPAAVA